MHQLMIQKKIKNVRYNAKAKAKAQKIKDHSEGKPSFGALNKVKEKIKDGLSHNFRFLKFYRYEFNTHQNFITP